MRENDMARKAMTKTVNSNTVGVEIIDDSLNTSNASEEISEIVEVASANNKTDIITTVREISTMKLDEVNEIVIEVSSDYWAHVYWKSEKHKILMVMFETNHSTTDADICRSSRKFVHDKFIYLAQKTFIA
jgi:hypothetical protein